MTRKHWINLLKLVVAAGLIWLVLQNVTLQDTTDEKGVFRKGLLSYLREMDVGLFLLGAVFYFLAASFSSLRWWWLLRVNDLDVGVGQAFRFTWIGIFFNNVVPGLTGGDVIKAVYVARATGRKLRPVLSVLVDRILGLVALAILAAVVVLFALDEPRFFWIAIGLWSGLLGLVVMTSLFLSRRVRRVFHIDALLKKLPMSATLMKFDEAMTHYRGHLKGILVWLLLSSLNHLVSVVGVIFIGKALHSDMPAFYYVILVPIINIVSAVPIAPAGWGVGEYLYQKGWMMFGVPFAPTGVSDAARYMGTQGVALSVVYRAHMMAWSLLGAVFLLVERGRPSQDEMTDLMDEMEQPASETAASKS